MIDGFWDAPLSGMLQMKEQLYWFEMIQENEAWEEGQWFRRHAIVQLTDEQLAREMAVHKDFQRYVGTHWDLKQVEPPPKFIEGQAQLFYDKHDTYIKSKSFEENEVIGWMER